VSKIAFMSIITALITAIILSSPVVVNTFAKSSGGDSSGGSDGGDKPKTSGNKKGDGGGMPVPGSPVVRVDNKHKDKDSNNGGRLIVPGSPVVTADSGSNDANSGYNNDNNIKKFDPSKSSFRIGGSDGKVVEYRPGFNETFYNSTLPYCFAVQSGSCYDSSTGHIIP
jgi:hypothetical protein